VQAALVSIDDMSSTRINTVYRFERVSGSEMVYAPRSCRSSLASAARSLIKTPAFCATEL
jgi:hypothetical protein